MEKSRYLLIAASVLVDAVLEIAVAQHTNAQANANDYTQERAVRVYPVPP